MTTESYLQDGRTCSICRVQQPTTVTSPPIVKERENGKNICLLLCNQVPLHRPAGSSEEEEGASPVLWAR